MKKFARLDANNIVIELFQHESYLPSDCHVADIAAQFRECPAHVDGRWFLNADNEWVAPAADPVAPAFVPPKVTPPQFYLLFTMEEQLTIEALRTTDPVLGLGFKRLDDPRLTEVDLALSSVQGLIRYALSKCHVGEVEERFAEIITGEFA